MLGIGEVLSILMVSAGAVSLIMLRLTMALQKSEKVFIKFLLILIIRKSWRLTFSYRDQVRMTDFKIIGQII